MDDRCPSLRWRAIMYDVLFENPAVVARYRTGPYAKSREQFLKEAQANGYSPRTLMRMAWALLVVAEIVRDAGGSITPERLRSALYRQVKSKWAGLSPVTITSCDEAMRWFFKSLPPRVRSLDAITLAHVDAFLKDHASRGWSRKSLHALACRLRSFFRYAGSRLWCRSDFARSIELPRIYKLEDVPRAPSTEQIDRLLEDTASSDDPVKVRAHAILSLLIHYGLRRGEVARLTLDDLDWAAETIHVTRPKMRRAQSYPMSVPVGEAILRYLRQARPRCPHRSLFLTAQAPIRPLSGPSITSVVRTLLTKQGVKLTRRGAHSLRHACAGQLLDAGFTLKQIADHLGHRSLDTTRIYTKIDLRGLRQVAEFDLGALL